MTVLVALAANLVIAAAKAVGGLGSVVKVASSARRAGRARLVLGAPPRPKGRGGDRKAQGGGASRAARPRGREHSGLR